MEPQHPPKLNAATRWMTSRETVIAGESEAALQSHLNHWNVLYPNVETDALLNDLVREAAFSSWLLLRSQRQYDSAVKALHQTQMEHWTPKHHHDFQLCERYLNASQRRLNGHRSDIFKHQSNLRSQAREDRSAHNYAEAEKAGNPEMETAPRVIKRDETILQQATVYYRDGVTETGLCPTNEHLLEHIAKSRYETTLVNRGFRFDNNVCPPEYEAFRERTATFKDLPHVTYVFLPITIRSLRIAVEREKEFGGHIREWPDLRQEDEPIIKLKGL